MLVLQITIPREPRDVPPAGGARTRVAAATPAGRARETQTDDPGTARDQLPRPAFHPFGRLAG